MTSWKQEEVDSLNNQTEKSFLLRYLIHVLGDIHQPLHASELFNDGQFKNGDFGGNLFKIKFEHGIDNLHALYDSVAGVLSDRFARV